MTKFNYAKQYSRKTTPQSEAIPGSRQVPNSGGGFSWAVSDWVRLDRFLILGTEGGSYYTNERALTRANAEAVERCIQKDGPRVVARIVEISDAGRAPKNDPALFALAMAAKLGDLATRQAAYAALPKVVRIGTHLMHFAEYMQAFGGWGRGARSAVGRWYNDRPIEKLTRQLVKYQSRDGWSNRDLLRLAHPKAATPEHDLAFQWVVKGSLPAPAPQGLAVIEAFEQLKKARELADVVRLVREFDLPRECVPTEWLTFPEVWEALLERMPMTAMIRNLATMTRVGLIAPLSAGTTAAVAKLADPRRLLEARVHPIAVLAALKTYQSGKGVKGQHTWKPVGAVVDALDAAFYQTFKTVEPTGKRTLLALDVSGSMGGGAVAGVPGLTPRIASTAMALVTAATEKAHSFVAFTAAPNGYGGKHGGGTVGIRSLDISPAQRLDDAVRRVSDLPFGGTDCAQPMLWAIENKVDVDTFVIYTDSETWHGDIHPAQALAKYRQERSRPAKLVVVGMVSNGFSIADPNDAGMLDVVGFDTATPALLTDFARN